VDAHDESTPQDVLKSCIPISNEVRSSQVLMNSSLLIILGHTFQTIWIPKNDGELDLLHTGRVLHTGLSSHTQNITRVHLQSLKNILKDNN
jgi:hypothetical protein